MILNFNNYINKIIIMKIVIQITITWKSNCILRFHWLITYWTIWIKVTVP